MYYRPINRHLECDLNEPMCVKCCANASCRCTAQDLKPPLHTSLHRAHEEILCDLLCPCVSIAVRMQLAGLQPGRAAATASNAAGICPSLSGIGQRLEAAGCYPTGLSAALGPERAAAGSRILHRAPAAIWPLTPDRFASPCGQQMLHSSQCVNSLILSWYI